MLYKLVDLSIIILLCVAGVTHILKLINIFYQPKLFKRLKFLSLEPSKIQLILYYLLTILVCSYGIFQKINI